MTSESTTFAQAQKAELDNWIKDTANVTRIIQELAEHSEISYPLRGLTKNRRFPRALEVGVGCYGLGFLACHFSDRIDRLDGLDPLPRLDLNLKDPDLQHYTQILRERVNYLVGMGEKLPFDSASFDLAASVNVVDHAQDPEKILTEMNRVLKPGGLFVFGVNTLSTLGEIKWKIGRRRNPKKFLYVAHPHTFQWSRADAMVRRVVPGKVIWRNKPSRLTAFAGHGRMSFWIVTKAG